MTVTTRGWAAGLAVVMCALGADAGWGDGLPVGTTGIGAGGSYATIEGNTRFGSDFGAGGGYHLLLRYTASRHISLGADFQNQTYGGQTSAPVGDLPAVEKLVMTAFEAEFLYFRNRNADASQYFLMSVGLYRPELRAQDNQDLFPGENFMFSAGLGVELYLRENWVIDLRGRGIGYVGDGIADQERDEIEPTTSSLSFGIQGQAAIIYYILK